MFDEMYFRCGNLALEIAVTIKTCLNNSISLNNCTKSKCHHNRSCVLPLTLSPGFGRTFDTVLSLRSPPTS